MIGKRAIALIAVPVVLLAVGLVVADRVGHSLAQKEVSDHLAGRYPFTTRPDVTIHGTPFLTQALHGYYKDIEVAGNGVTVSKLTNVDIDAHLRGVSVPLTKVFDTSRPLPVREVDVTLTIPLASIETASKVEGLKLTFQGLKVEGQASVVVGTLGRVLVTGVGDIVAAGDSIELEASTLTVKGVPLTGKNLTIAERELKLRVSLPRLPYDSRLTSAKTTAAGLVLTGTADNVQLKP